MSNAGRARGKARNVSHKRIDSVHAYETAKDSQSTAVQAAADANKALQDANDSLAAKAAVVKSDFASATGTLEYTRPDGAVVTYERDNSEAGFVVKPTIDPNEEVPDDGGSPTTPPTGTDPNATPTGDQTGPGDPTNPPTGLPSGSVSDPNAPTP